MYLEVGTDSGILSVSVTKINSKSPKKHTKQKEIGEKLSIFGLGWSPNVGRLKP